MSTPPVAGDVVALWNHDADWFDARILAWLTEVVQRRGAASAR
ncbi:hypothetical protein NYS52_12150 [Curtobacterium flaccumfaciens pv. flaccumfaciens]|nr:MULTISPECIES: hypothetical protein [Curtobacterium]MCS6565292.1 hypothetical protein [Curtobacterium flaccumfaciens pv. flaccumfaciens]MCS6575281.1 hypothetical protein [Curtobacterium flaccumfaciens pv. flaccumfaciens]WNY34320.1 hypothetical protein Q9Q99_02220 [Curtobacterium flaccumfaciens]